MKEKENVKIQKRLYSNMPIFGKCLRRKAIGILVKSAMSGDNDSVKLLAKVAIDHNKTDIRNTANYALKHLKSHDSICALCLEWLKSREKVLEKIIIQSSYVAESPLELQVFSALLTGKTEYIVSDRNDIFDILTKAANDENKDIAKRAKQMLLEHSNAELTDENCIYWIDGIALEEILSKSSYVSLYPVEFEARVISILFDRQKDFLRKGNAYLMPLTLKDIGDSAGIHESTVSRMIKNKYVKTQHGIFELKSLFSSGISTYDGQMVSSVSVKEMIKNIIVNENTKKPFSDKDIVEILGKEGISIARRTVAKYREELDIQPSNKRKRI